MLKNFTIVDNENCQVLLPEYKFKGVRHFISNSSNNVYTTIERCVVLVRGDNNKEELDLLKSFFEGFVDVFSVQSNEILWNNEYIGIYTNDNDSWFAETDSWFVMEEIADDMGISPELLVLVLNYVFGC